MNRDNFIQTPEFILAFPNLFEPRGFEETGKEKYSCVMVFPKGTDLSTLKDAAKVEYNKKFAGMKSVRSPFCDGNEKVDEWGDAFKDATYIRVSSNFKPGVCDAGKKRITDPDLVYSGVIARAIVHIFSYDTKGNRGISFGLDAVQILRDGEPIGGSGAAIALFDEVPGAETAAKAEKEETSPSGLFD